MLISFPERMFIRAHIQNISMKNRISIIIILLLMISIEIIPVSSENKTSIIYATPYEFSAYSQFYADNYIDKQWINAVSAGLYTRDNISYAPYLADGDPVISDDKLTYTVTLKQDLKFSDGSPLTADDVVFTYQSLNDQNINKVTYNYFSSIFASENYISKIDEMHVKFIFRKVSFTNMHALTAPIQPKDHFTSKSNWNEFGDSISAGPYKLTTFDEVNQEVILDKNEYFFDAKNVLNDRLIFKKISSAEDAINALSNDEIQIMDGMYYQFADNVEIPENTYSINVTEMAHYEMALNHKHPYYGTGDKLNISNKLEGARDVRLAMSYVLDRETIAKEIMEGKVSPTATIVPPITPGWSDKYATKEYSITKAKNYMEKAGFNYSLLGTVNNNGNYEKYFFNVTIFVPDTGASKIQWPVYFAEQLSKIGIGTEMLYTSWSVIIPRTFGSIVPPPIYSEGGFDMLAVGFTDYLDFDPYGLYESDQIIPNGYNFYNYNNSDYDKLEYKYLHELDSLKRKDILTQLQEFYYNNEIVLSVFFPMQQWFVSDKLTGYNCILMNNAEYNWKDIAYSNLIETSNNSFIEIPIQLSILGLIVTLIIIHKKIVYK